jgi:predicted aspartyl protease
MPILNGSIMPWGPSIYLKVMQSNQRATALKKAGRPHSEPIVIHGLIDTGASISALDLNVIQHLDIQPHGSISIHTPSTGTAYETRDTYDASLVLGETEVVLLVVTTPMLGIELASQGFDALLGRDVLRHCRLVFDGPGKSVTLEYRREEDSPRIGPPPS